MAHSDFEGGAGQKTGRVERGQRRGVGRHQERDLRAHEGDRVAPALDVSRMKDGDFAGLALLQKHYGLVGVEAEGGKRYLVMVSAEAGAPVEVERVPLDQETVFLKAECDFRETKDEARFFYSLDGRSWAPIGSVLKMKYTLPHFMGFFRVSDRITD